MQKQAEPKYETIKKYILAEINNEKYKPGERLPSEIDLSNLFKVSIITSRRALTDLCNEGIIYRIQGSGSFVSDREKRPDPVKNTGTKLVAIVLSLIKHYNDMFLDIIKGAQTHLEKNGYSMIFHYHESNPEKERKIVEGLLERPIDGLILYSYDPEENRDLILKLRQQRFPFVLIDRYTKDVPANIVVSDNYDGAYQAVEYLVGLNHRRIGFISNESVSLSTVCERYQGYSKALMNHGIGLDESLVFFTYEHNIEEAVQRVTEGGMTAIFAANDYLAINFLKEAEKKGLSAPRDFSIIGFDDVPSARLYSVPLTTVRQPFYEIGRTAADILVQNMEDRNRGCQRVVLPNTLICRQSSEKRMADGKVQKLV